MKGGSNNTFLPQVSNGHGREKFIKHLELQTNNPGSFSNGSLQTAQLSSIQKVFSPKNQFKQSVSVS